MFYSIPNQSKSFLSVFANTVSGRSYVESQNLNGYVDTAFDLFAKKYPQWVDAQFDQAICRSDSETDGTNFA